MTAWSIKANEYLTHVANYSERKKVIAADLATFETTRVLRHLFVQQGLLNQMVSEKGSELTSALFRDCCQKNYVQNAVLPPRRPKLSGRAETFVG